MIGEGERGHAELRGLLDQLLEAGGAVEQAVLGVDVQVDEVAVLFRALTPTRWCSGGLEEMS